MGEEIIKKEEDNVIEENQLQSKDFKEQIFNLCCLLLAGVGLGWMIGMSKDPVIINVITPLLTVVIALTSYLSGIKNANTLFTRLNKDLNPKPIAITIFGLALGVYIGLCQRANHHFRTAVPHHTKAEIDTILSIYAGENGLDSNVILNRLYEIDFVNDTSLIKFDTTLIKKVNEQILMNKNGKKRDFCDEIKGKNAENQIFIAKTKFKRDYEKIKKKGEAKFDEVILDIMKTEFNCNE